MFSANSFALSDAEDDTCGPLNRGGVADLPLLRTLLAIHQKSQEPSFWELMDSCFISLKNPFGMVARLSEFYFRFTLDLILL